MGKIKIEKSSEKQLFNYKSRLEKLLNLTTENILITKLENIFYLTGFKGSAGWLFISNAQKYLLVDSRYFEVASQVTDNTNVVLVANLYEDTLYLLLEELSIKQFTIAKNSLYLNEYDNIVSKMTSHSIKVSTTNIDIDIIRSTKEKEEIKIIKENLNKAEVALTKTLAFIKEGVSEQELAAELEYQMRKEGGDKTSFDTILLFGERSSLPHGVPTERKLKFGDNILIDFGLSKNGYQSDITRTLFFGRGNNFDRMSKIYNIVKDANEKSVEAIKHSVSGKSIDLIARDIIKTNGYGEYFGHSLGHGVGIDIHELPRLSPFWDNTLQSGNVVTIEPGIYIPNIGGVRIENMAVVTKDGCSILNNTPIDLIVL